MCKTLNYMLDARMSWKEANARKQKKKDCFHILEAELRSDSLSLTEARTAAGGLPGRERKDESSEVLGQYCGL